MLIRIFLSGFLFFSASLNAEIYRWVDDQGRTHFGDRPFGQANVESVTASSETSKEPGDAGVSEQERKRRINDFLEQRAREREETQAAKAAADKEAAKRRELCRKLRARLVHMNSISTFYDLNDQGERVFVSESENKKIRDRFRGKVKDTCSN